MPNESTHALHLLTAELSAAAQRSAASVVPTSALQDYGLTAAELGKVLQRAADRLQDQRGRNRKRLTASTILTMLRAGRSLAQVAERLLVVLDARPQSRRNHSDAFLAMKSADSAPSEATLADGMDRWFTVDEAPLFLETKSLPTPPSKRATPPEAITQRVLFATDRKPAADRRLGMTYGGTRAGALTYGECEVSVPKDRLMGTLPLPRLTRLEFRAVRGRHVILTAIEPLTVAGFFTRTTARLAESAANDLFVFIHGYKTEFSDAVLRTAQLAVDLRLQGPPVLYSWPARGNVLAYKQDEDSVAATADRFRTFLADLATRTGADRINILAHSMGSRAVCDALKVLGHAGKGPAQTRIANVVFAAPDVDAEAYRNMAEAMVKPSGSVTLYASAKDRALRMSRQLSGAPRAGEPLIIAPGIDSIDASDVNTDFLQHGYFALAREILHDLYDLFGGVPATARFGLEPRSRTEGPYFHFRA
ncbi:MAG: alpha/beta hydrolase [Pseudomonadota bacterium]